MHQAYLIIRVAFVATFLLAVLAAGSARAQSTPARVVVDNFKGPKAVAKQLRLEVIGALDGLYELLPVNELDAARSTLSLAGSSDDEIAQLAKEIRAAAVVGGTVAKKGRGLALTLTVRLGDSGEVLEEAEVRFRRAKPSKRESAAVRTKIGAMMKTFDARWDELLAAAAEEERLEKERAAAAAATAEKATKTKAAKGAKAASVTRTSETRRGAPRGFRGGLDVGSAFVGRELAFTVGDNIAPEMRPFAYESGPVGGVLVSGQVFPFGAFGGFMDNLAVTFLFDRTIGYKSNLGAEAFDTVRARFGGGLRYVQPFGEGADPVTVGVGAGYGQQSHSIDTGDTVIALPNVNYSYVDLGLTLRVPIAGGVAVEAAGSYLVVLSTGDFEELENYGGNSVIAFDVDAGLSWQLFGRVALRGGARFARVSLTFDGTGDLTEIDADGNQDVGGASDTYLGGYVTAGYRF